MANDYNVKQQFGMDGNIRSELLYVNRFGLRNPDLQLGRTFGKVFFTKPDMNLFLDDARMSPEASKIPFLNLMNVNYTDSLILAELQFSRGSNSTFINPIIGYAENFEIVDEAIKTRQSSETSTEYKIIYGTRSADSKAAGSFNISYTDDRNLTIYKLHKTWVEYIDLVSTGKLSPKREYILKNKLDYASSVYYFLLAEDGETILFFAKYYGVFPTNAPGSTYSWSKGEYKKPSIQIQYQYSFEDQMNPLIISEFNRTTTSASHSSGTLEQHNFKDLSLGKAYVNRPYIEIHKDVYDGMSYKLKYI